MRKIRYGLPTALAVTGLVVFFAAAVVYPQGAYPPDFQLKQTGAMPPTTFSHKVHAEEAKRQCTDCHTKVFQMKVGATTGGKPMTMAEMNQGKYCGACHNGKAAFPALRSGAVRPAALWGGGSRRGGGEGPAGASRAGPAPSPPN